MAAAPEREEDPAPRPAVDSTVSFFPTTICLKIVPFVDPRSVRNWALSLVTRNVFNLFMAGVVGAVLGAVVGPVVGVVAGPVNLACVVGTTTPENIRSTMARIAEGWPLDLVMGAVTDALKGTGLQVGNVIKQRDLFLVELRCDRREQFPIIYGELRDRESKGTIA